MTAPALKISHAKDAQFDRGLRSFFEYRDLGVWANQARAAATSTSCSCSWWRCSGAGSSLTMKAAAWSGLKPAPAFISHRAPATAKSGTATTWKCSKSSCPQISGRKPPDHDPPKRLTPTHVVLGHISPCQATQQRGAATWLTLHSLPASRPRIRCS